MSTAPTSSTSSQPPLSTIPFSTFCAALRSLRAANSRHGRTNSSRKSTVAASFRKVRNGVVEEERNEESKRDVLTRFWKEVAGRIDIEARKAEDCDTADADDADGVFEPHTALGVDDTVALLSMLCPYLDEDHPLYHMKETRVAQHYLDALGFPRYQEESVWLLKYRDAGKRPKVNSYRNKKARRASAAAQDGVFVSVLTAVITTRASAKSNPKLTLGRVWQLLTILKDNAETGGSMYRAHGARPKYGAEESGDDAAGVEVKSQGSGGKEADPYAAAKKEIVRKKDARIGVFREMLKYATAAENAEFARLILKEMDIRVSGDVLLNWFHRDAKKYYDSQHALRGLVVDVRKPGFSMTNISIKPGMFASVALAARPTKANLPSLAARLASGVAGTSNWIDDGGKDGFFYMEPKLDGERMQLHKLGNHIETFTRSKKNSTELFGTLLKEAVCHAVCADTAILDGEIMLWDETTRKWVSFDYFRSTVTDMKKQEITQGDRYVLKFCIFDILYLSQSPAGRSGVSHSEDKTEDDSHSQPTEIERAGATQPKRSAKKKARAPDSLIQLPLWQRREILQKIVKPGGYTSPLLNGFRTAVEIVEVKLGRSESDLTDYLNETVMAGYEGLVAKSPVCNYGLAIRDPARVIKLKPDYFEGGLTDLDVIILGGKYSSGQGTKKGRIGGLSSFLIGVRTHNSDREKDRYESSPNSCQWTPVGNLGTGYDDEQLRALRDRLQPYWKDVRPGGRDELPGIWDVWYDEEVDQYGRSLPPRPKQAESMFADVVKWIEPQDSVVLQVRAYELSRAKGYALRFPRCDRIRGPSEKGCHEIISLEELVELDSVKVPPVIASDAKDIDEVDANAAPAREKKRRQTKLAADKDVLKAQKTRVQQSVRSGLKVDQTRVATDVSDLLSKDRSSVLTGFCFRVFSTLAHDRELKAEIERQIYRMGGTFNQDKNSEKITHFVAVDSSCPDVERIRNAAAENRNSRACCISILRRAWLEECEEQGKRVPIERHHVFFASTDLNKSLLRDKDIFGDPWRAPPTRATFLDCLTEMDRMKSRGDLPVVPRTMDSGTADGKAIEKSVAKAMLSSGALFWNLTASSATLGTAHAPLQASSLLFRFFGGTFIGNSVQCCNNDADEGPGEMDTSPEQDVRDATHILVAESTTAASYQTIKESIGSPLARDCAFVSCAWVQACIDVKTVLPAFVSPDKSW